MTSRPNSFNPNLISSTNSFLKVAYFNANGILKQKFEIINYLHKHDIDVMLINETHLYPNIKFNIQGYQVLRTDRTHNSGGGTAIVIKQHLKFTKHNLPNTGRIENTAAIIYSGFSDPFLFVSVYNPPQSVLNNSDLANLTSSDLPTIIAGDLNAKSTVWNSNLNNRNGTILNNFAHSHNIRIIAPDMPTRYHYDGRADILDIIIMNNIYSTPYLEVTEELSSDHLPVKFDFYGFYSPLIKPKTKINWNIYTKELISLPCGEHLRNSEDIEKAIQKFNLKIQQAISRATYVVNPNNYQALPQYIKNLIQERNRQRKTWHLTRDPSDKRHVNYLTRKIAKEIIKYRSENWNNLMENIDLNPNLIWKIARSIRTTKTNYHHPILHRGHTHNKEEDIAEVMAQSLETVFEKHDDSSPFDYYINNEIEEIRLRTSRELINLTSPEEIKEILKKLKKRKAHGYDKITNEALQALPRNCIVILCNLINACIRNSYFPKAWKHSIVKMLLKPGKNPADVSSYRPISLLPAISKVFERIIASRLNIYINQLNDTDSQQFGFKRAHSTSHQILNLIEFISVEFQKKNAVAACYLDFEKAFDRVWHAGLIYKLAKLNPPNSFLNLMINYLEDRTFQIRCGDSLSSTKNIYRGLPQGSVISPMNFNLYANDMPKSEIVKILKYADDTVILANSMNPQFAVDKLQNQVKIIEKWCKKWKVNLNPNKCCTVLYRRYKKNYPVNMEIQINNAIIPTSNSYKYLGVFIDSQLTFKEHINYVTNKANAAFMALYPLLGRKSKLQLNTKRTLYLTLIRPILLYAVPTWATACKTARNKLSVLQNKILRAITNARWFIRNSQINHELKIPEIQEQILIYSHKFFVSVQNSQVTAINNLANYDPTEENVVKRPRTIHHNAKW
ncbi:putative RNA-directed DNA polymerase from transposon X-element, partial [Stegodyphus mimosarum]